MTQPAPREMRRPGLTAEFQCLLRPVVVLAVAALLGAAVKPMEQDLLHQAAVAYADGEYGQALELLAEAELLTLDPGLVAFNKGAAHFKLGNYREAELHYVCALEDAEGERRARAWYDLGNALVKQADDTNIPLLKRAVAAYVECLHMELSDTLFDDARNNLDIAQGLLNQARSQAKGDPSRPSEEDKPDEPKDDPRKLDKRFTSAQPDEVGEERKTGSEEEGDLSEEAKQASKANPGRSKLPPIPENERMVPMSAEDTAAYLRREAARILEDRQRQKTHVPVKQPPHVPMW